MKLTTIELRRIDASEGMVLTNGQAFSDVGGFIYLACNDSPENWYEITDEKAEEIQKAKEGEINGEKISE